MLALEEVLAMQLDDQVDPVPPQADTVMLLQGGPDMPPQGAIVPPTSDVARLPTDPEAASPAAFLVSPYLCKGVTHLVQSMSPSEACYAGAGGSRGNSRGLGGGGSVCSSEGSSDRRMGGGSGLRIGDHSGAVSLGNSMLRPAQVRRRRRRVAG